MELAAEVSGAAVGHVGGEDVRGVHDEDRPAEKYAYRSCTSRSSLQAR